jgi:hypothetical protein
MTTNTHICLHPRSTCRAGAGRLGGGLLWVAEVLGVLAWSPQVSEDRSGYPGYGLTWTADRNG